MTKNEKKMNSVNGLSLSMVKGAIVTEVMLPGVTAASEGEFTLPMKAVSGRGTASEEEAEGGGAGTLWPEVLSLSLPCGSGRALATHEVQGRGGASSANSTHNSGC